MNQTITIAEENARAAARGDYLRWLAKRFGDIDLMQTKEGEEKVSLRKIYIPVRLDTEERFDEQMPDPSRVTGEELLGLDAGEVIAQQPFVAISGRPGSGKTTLVQALMGELVRDGKSELREKISAEGEGILPVPLILRALHEELERAENLSELLDGWWAKAREEAADKKYRLDVERLRAMSTEGMTMLLFFDGIDEVGGAERRGKIFALALEAVLSGHRVVITGRPSGFLGLDDEAVSQATQARIASANDGLAVKLGLKAKEFLKEERWVEGVLAGVGTLLTAWAGKQEVDKTDWLYHVQPFTWPQIQQFIDAFYRLHDEWKVERDEGIAQINAALEDFRRPYLLTLARRPIFLTLMALVHVNDSRMPYGRADLYGRIIDLYLIRQTNQRKLKHNLKGLPMPQWDEREVRRALGYLAWRSQHKAAEVGLEDEADARRVVWSRQAMEAELTDLISGGEEAAHGRFNDLTAEKAPELLDYFLHPAGLLVEPADGEIQFAHLSFQEYLCAEYIHGRIQAAGIRRFLEETNTWLFSHLERPGWDEVGILFLTIHSGIGAQGTGDAHLELLAELDPMVEAQAQLLASALCGRELPFTDSQRESWLPLLVASALPDPDADWCGELSRVIEWWEPARALMTAVVSAANPYKHLANAMKEVLPQGYYDFPQLEGRIQGLEKRWASLARKAQEQNLLVLINVAGWGDPDGERHPDGEGELELALAAKVEKGVTLFQSRRGEHLSTPAQWELEVLSPRAGPLWHALLSSLPLEMWLHQLMIQSRRPSTVYAIFPQERLPVRPRLAFALDQAVRLIEAAAYRGVGSGFLEGRIRPHPLVGGGGRRMASVIRARSRARKMLHSSRGDLTRSLSLSVGYRRDIRLSAFRVELLKELARSSVLSESLQQRLHEIYKRVINWRRVESRDLFAEIGRICTSVAALEWFESQVVSPELTRLRGGKPRVPLPADLGLFTKKGLIRRQQSKAGWQALQAWLDSDEKILKFVFPEGLSGKERKLLIDDLAALRRQPWSPMVGVAEVLEKWPSDASTFEISPAAIERCLASALDQLEETMTTKDGRHLSLRHDGASAR